MHLPEVVVDSTGMSMHRLVLPLTACELIAIDMKQRTRRPLDSLDPCITGGSEDRYILDNKPGATSFQITSKS